MPPVIDAQPQNQSLFNHDFVGSASEVFPTFIQVVGNGAIVGAGVGAIVGAGVGAIVGAGVVAGVQDGKYTLHTTIPAYGVGHSTALPTKPVQWELYSTALAPEQEGFGTQSIYSDGRLDYDESSVNATVSWLKCQTSSCTCDPL